MHTSRSTGRRHGAAKRVLTLAFLLTASVLPARTQSATSSIFPIPYDLSPKSHYEEGCFAPCMCPIFFTDGFEGSFSLSFSGFERPFIVYDVKDIRWSVPALGKTFTGSGRYLIGWKDVPQQQLQVDLSENGGLPARFDSGLVPVTAPFPVIDVAVSMHGFYCYDKGLFIKAAPARPVRMSMQVQPPDVSWDLLPDAPGYDVVFGSLNVLRQTGGDFTAATTACLASDTASSPAGASDNPPAGEAFWYLVRARGGVAGTTYDSGDPGQGGTCDARIDASPDACH
jgi:hypothetical protein